jgi:riboflavin synthase
MYTGITQGLFTVSKVEASQDCINYQVTLNTELTRNLKIGASVAVDGVCQTVVAIDNNNVAFNAAGKTLEITTLSDLKAGQQVSIERSAAIGDEIGGHQMAGHVFETAEVISKEHKENNLLMTFRLSNKAMEFVFDKGFIGIDGSSLTVHEVNSEDCTFMVNLIPHTIELTNFANKNVGDKVNIEIDANTMVIVETVKRYMDSSPRPAA